MGKTQFIFDANKCTGCRACEIACKIENQLDVNTNWRRVVTYNKDQKPDQPYYHLSIACNHCEDAPCMKYCPALAIFRDNKTGAVIIDENKCIGCGYCSWVCPYDAPAFNFTKGVMEKCTFCNHRLEEGMTTACVSVCPTGALFTEQYESVVENNITGFPETGIKPKIKIKSIRKKNILPEFSQPYDESILSLLSEKESEPKIDVKKEWVLAVFSFIFMFLTSMFTAAEFVSLDLLPMPFLISGVMAMGISVIHLGKKDRAFRAILNLKNSWLSREILFASLFLGSAFIYLLIGQKSAAGLFISFIGFAALFAIDSVYRVIPKKEKSIYKNNQLFISAVFFIGILISIEISFFILVILKILLWLNNSRLSDTTTSKTKILFFYSKIVFGFVMPIIIGLTGYREYFYYSVISILASELIERFEFYIYLEPITPQSEIEN
ncbi:MAG: 4Fe-4S binding protein [Melioribacteraceae bacterium]|nr:4Fe-4S binding protein [Melioribacteraceae bacterium]